MSTQTQPATARIPAQRARRRARRDVDPTAPVYSCYLPHCAAATEYRTTVADMRWYRCTRCGMECPEVAFHQRPVVTVSATT